jgi:hypothetical protein
LPAAPPHILGAGEPAAEALAASDATPAAAAAADESTELPPVTADEGAVPAAPEALLAFAEPQAVVTFSIEIAAEAPSGQGSRWAADEPLSVAAEADLDEAGTNAAPVASPLVSPASVEPVPPQPAPKPPPSEISVGVPDLVTPSEPQVVEHAADAPPALAAPEATAPLRAEEAETILVEAAPGRPEAMRVPETRAEEAPVSAGLVAELLPSSVVETAPRSDPVERVAPTAISAEPMPAISVEPAPVAEAGVLFAEARQPAAEALAGTTPPVPRPLQVARPADAARTLADTAQSVGPAPAASAAGVTAAAAIPVGAARVAAPAARLEAQPAQQVTVTRPTAPAAAPAIAADMGVALGAAATETAPRPAVAEVRQAPLAGAALPPPLVAPEAGSAQASLTAASPAAAAAPLVKRTPTRIGGQPAPVPDAVPVTRESTELAAEPVVPRISTGRDPESEIEDVVRGYGCARVSALYEINNGAVTLSGHLRSAADRDDLLDNLVRIPGVSRVEAADLHIIGDPYCRVLAFLSRPEFVRSDDERADISAIGDPVQASVDRIEAGTLLEMEMIAPDFPSHIYVDYFAVDGNVYHLLPTNTLDEGRFEPDQRFGLGGGYERGLKVKIGPPFGLDLILAIASSEPLFDAVRPTVENAEDYLAALGAAIDAAEARNPDLRLGFAYHLMYTGPAASQ